MSDIPNLSSQCKVITPSSPEYEKAISRNTLTAVIPAKYVAYPSTPSDVSAILKFARTQNPHLPIAVKGGGLNSYPVSSSEGITIDMSQIRHVRLAEDKKSVTVGGGAIWEDVYAPLDEQGLIAAGANVWNVGVAAYVLGGGFSNLTPAHGYGCDSLLEGTIVLADGRIVKCDADNEPDLFWALRGNFNQAFLLLTLIPEIFSRRWAPIWCSDRTGLEDVPSHGPAFTGAIIYPANELQSFLNVLKKRLSTPSPKQVFILGFSRAAPDYYPTLLFIPYVEGTPEEVDAVISPFRTEITPLLEQTVTLTSFMQATHATDGITKQFPPRRINGGALFGSLWDDLILSMYDEWLKFTENSDSKTSLALWEFYPPGRNTEIDIKDTAYPCRKQQNYFHVYGLHSSPERDTPTREWIEKVTSKVNAANLEKMGFKFPIPHNSGTGLEAPEDIYGEHLQRLRELKTKYDPHQMFNKKYWTIPPLTSN
ncbi:hypothetical protein Clacol_010120 [Clathrus columnatus]|uniref:FAD-binding PCMH-type domain-containing protein n=1 Tax=Clathrus columnatus TaxID=1419009 RepID=A0AAV5AMD1_9AGAM|nr:hypothetical protein Clacol_010120 [Clathrus columnatus]